MLRSFRQGYAPGSWSQVAVERTKPTGRVVGIDIIPAQPPKHVSTIQGNFLHPNVQEMVKQFILESHQRDAPEQSEESTEDETDVVSERPSYIDMERHTFQDEEPANEPVRGHKDRLVDVSDPKQRSAGLVMDESSLGQRTGGTKRHVSTLVTDHWIFKE